MKKRLSKQEIEEKIEELRKWGYVKVEFPDSDPRIRTPRGYEYNYRELLRGECPICNEYLRDHPEETGTVCSHNKTDTREIKIARNLAKLLQLGSFI